MINEIIKLKEEGYSVVKIADKLGLTKGRVDYFIRKHKYGVKLLDIETSEMVSVKDIKFEEKIFHYIESMGEDVDVNKFTNLLHALKEYLPKTKTYTKKTLRGWRKKNKYTDSSLFSMEWIYDLYVQQSDTCYRFKNINGQRYISGFNFYGTIKWKSRAKEIGNVINRFIKEGYDITLENINKLDSDVYTAPLKYYYLPIAKVLWWNYGCDVMQDLNKLPNFLYYRTAGKEDIPIEMRREVIGQHMNNQAIVPKFVLYSWGLPPSCSMEDYFKVMGILS